MATRRYDEEEPVVQAPVDRASYGGSVYDQQHFTDDELRRAAEIRAAAERGETDWASAHDYVEGIRSGYGYTGGVEGDKYSAIPSSTPVKAQTFTYESAPQYASKYADQINELTQQILNRPGFTYDPNADESYLAYKDQYTRLGQQAMKDTLGQVSARTGGLASSYATTAAEQAYGNYMSALADRIPALKQAAYAMYQDQAANDRANLSMLQALEQGDYAKYQDLLNQYNADRGMSYQQFRDSVADQRYANETDYNRSLDQRNYDYQISRDAIADSRYADETSYNRGIDERNYQYQLGRDAVADQRYNTEWQYQVDQDAQDRAYRNATTAADAGDYSQLARLLGVDLSTAQRLYDAQAAAGIRQANLSGYPTYSGGGSGRSGASASVSAPSAAELAADRLRTQDPKNYANILRLAEQHLNARGSTALDTEAEVYTFLGNRVPQVAAMYGDDAAEVYRQLILDNTLNTAPATAQNTGFRTNMTSEELTNWLVNNGGDLSSTVQKQVIDAWKSANPAAAEDTTTDAKVKSDASKWVSRAEGKGYNSKTIWEFFAANNITDDELRDAIAKGLGLTL